MTWVMDKKAFISNLGKYPFHDAIIILVCFLKHNTGLCGAKITGLEALDCLDTLASVYPKFCTPMMLGISDIKYPEPRQHFVELWDSDIYDNMRGYLLSIAHISDLNFYGIPEYPKVPHSRQMKFIRYADPDIVKHLPPKFTFID